MPDAAAPQELDGITVYRASGPASSTEASGLLQQRLEVFALLMCAMFAALYVVGIVAVLVTHPDLMIRIHVHPTKLFNLGVAVGSGAIVLLLRKNALSLFWLRVVDVVLALGISWSATVALSRVPVGYVATFGAFLFVSLTLALRAALVPSPPRRTAVLGLLNFPTLVPMAYWLAVDDPSLPRMITPGLFTFGTAIWCTAITVVTTVTSRVIYGLERRVRTASELGQYTLLEKLGEGGMGAVYRARHAMLRRPTAVKLLPPERAGVASIARFEREVQLTSMLTHPNTIAIYDFGRTTDGIFYYAMEYVDGVSLEELVRFDGVQPAARVIHLMRQVAGALAEAHRIGLIHRDVKPANVLVCDRGGVPDSVKVVDFGLVKQLEAQSDVTLTQANTITGTPAYLAPEMITSPESVDGRADIYELGCVGYFMLTGGTVFEAGSSVEMCGHHLHTTPQPPSTRSSEPVPERLEKLILSCLAKLPADRPSSAEELEGMLAEIAAQHAWSTSEATGWWQKWRASRGAGAQRGVNPNATTVRV